VFCSGCMDVRGVIVCSAGRGIWFIYSATMVSGVVMAYTLGCYG